MNEELQSANEELETSKEELQSINEELQTVNSELNARVEELGRANPTSPTSSRARRSPPCSSTAISRQKLHPVAKDIFRLVESDTGRPISHVRSRFDPIRCRRTPSG